MSLWLNNTNYERHYHSKNSQYTVIFVILCIKNNKIQQISQCIVIFLHFTNNSISFVYNYQHIGNMKTLGAQIRERRKALKITQQELADLAGISINTVVAAERGQGDPKISTYLSICNVLGLKLTAIL